MCRANICACLCSAVLSVMSAYCQQREIVVDEIIEEVLRVRHAAMCTHERKHAHRGRAALHSMPSHLRMRAHTGWDGISVIALVETGHRGPAEESGPAIARPERIPREAHLCRWDEPAAGRLDQAAGPGAPLSHSTTWLYS